MRPNKPHIVLDVLNLLAWTGFTIAYWTKLYVPPEWVMKAVLVILVMIFLNTLVQDLPKKK